AGCMATDWRRRAVAAAAAPGQRGLSVPPPASGQERPASAAFPGAAASYVTEKPLPTMLTTTPPAIRTPPSVVTVELPVTVHTLVESSETPMPVASPVHCVRTSATTDPGDDAMLEPAIVWSVRVSAAAAPGVTRRSTPLPAVTAAPPAMAIVAG